MSAEKDAAFENLFFEACAVFTQGAKLDDVLQFKSEALRKLYNEKTGYAPYKITIPARLMYNRQSRVVSLKEGKTWH